jgi:hypothetical protein
MQPCFDHSAVAQTGEWLRVQMLCCFCAPACAPPPAPAPAAAMLKKENGQKVNDPFVSEFF